MLFLVIMSVGLMFIVLCLSVESLVLRGQNED